MCVYFALFPALCGAAHYYFHFSLAEGSISYSIKYLGAGDKQDGEKCKINTHAFGEGNIPGCEGEVQLKTRWTKQDREGEVQRITRWNQSRRGEVQNKHTCER
jgi:hypothetical protein